MNSTGQSKQVVNKLGRFFPFFWIWACLLGLFFLYTNQAKNFSIQDHSFQLSVLPFLLLSLLSLLVLGGIWILTAKILSSSFAIPFRRALSLDFLNYLPLFFLLLFPLVSVHYLNSADLILRLKLLGIAALFSLVLLKGATVFVLTKERPPIFVRHIHKIASLPLRKKLVLLFVTALIFYGAGSAILVTKGISFSGDEPHYLLITHSVIKDGDFDLSNNYTDRDYATIMPPGVRIAPHIAPGTGGKYSFHSPGLSLLLLPFYAIGSLFERTTMLLIIRCGMGVFGALLGLQIFLFARDEWRKEDLAFGLWGLFSFTSPVFFYSIHVYPEILVALFSLTVFRLLRFKKSFTKLHLLGLGFLLSAIIWFHAVKYVFILLPLFLYAFWVLVIKQKLRWEILYFLFYQRDGLLFYAPVYLFAFLGMIEMGKRKPRDLVLILCLTGFYILNLAFLTQRPAYAPQARTLVAVFWAMAVFLGYFLAFNTKKIFGYILSLFVFFSVLATLLLLQTPRALYQPTTAGETERAGLLFLQLSNLHFSLPECLPSFLKVEGSFWLPNLVWIALSVLFIVAYVLTKKHAFSPKYSHFLSGVMIGLGVFYLWFVFYPQTVIVHPKNITYPGGERVSFYAYSRSARMTAPGVFDLVEDDRLYSFYFSSWRILPELRLDLDAEGDVYKAEVKYFDTTIFLEKISREVKTLRFLPVPSYDLKTRNLYHISIYLENLSDADIQKSPFRFSIQPIR